MPIYSYRCLKCGYEFDDLMPMDSVPELPCRAKYVEGICEGMARRIPSVPGPPVFNCEMPTYRKPKT